MFYPSGNHLAVPFARFNFQIPTGAQAPCFTKTLSDGSAQRQVLILGQRLSDIICSTALTPCREACRCPITDVQTLLPHQSLAPSTAKTRKRTASERVCLLAGVMRLQVSVQAGQDRNNAILKAADQARKPLSNHSYHLARPRQAPIAAQTPTQHSIVRYIRRASSLFATEATH